MDNQDVPNPRIKLIRDPLVESAVLKYIPCTLKQKPQNKKPSEQCFICGDTKIASSRQAPRRYQAQVKVFKGYILLPAFRTSIKPQLCAELETNVQNNTCSNCLSDIKEVCDIHEQILSLKQDIEGVVKKARNKIRLREVEIKTEACHSESDDESFEISPIDDEDFDFMGEDISDNDFDSMEKVEGSFDTDSEKELATRRSTRPVKSKARKKFKVKDSNDVLSDYDEEEEEENNESNNGESSDRKKCTKCEKTFKTKRNMLEHFRQKHTASGKKNHCEPCDRFFSTKSLLTNHKRQKHILDENLKCGKCGKILGCSRALIIHQISVCKIEVAPEVLVKHKIKTRECEECDRKFFNKSDFTRHKLTHTGLKLFPCSKCNAKFTHKDSAISHEKTVCGTEEDRTKFRESRRLTKQASKNKPLSKCPKCSIRFLHEKNLTKHLASSHPEDTSLLNVICDLCGKQVLRSSLYGHVKRVHKEKQLKCAYCSKRFYVNSELKKHIKNIHEKDTTPSSPLPRIQCDTCGLDFANLTNLRHHQARIHQRNKKHECDVCKFRFYSYQDLLRHKKTHNKQLFNCIKCQMNFNRQSSLEKHQQRFPNCDDNPSKMMSQINDVTRKREKQLEYCDSCKLESPNKRFMDKHIRDVHPELWDWTNKRRKDYDVELNNAEIEVDEFCEVPYLQPDAEIDD